MLWRPAAIRNRKKVAIRAAFLFLGFQNCSVGQIFRGAFVCIPNGRIEWDIGIKVCKDLPSSPS